MEEKNLDKHFLFDNNEIQNLESKLVELRLNGQTKISQLKDEIDIVKTNKFSDKNQKKEEISSLKAQLAEARNDKKAHSEEIKTTVKEALKITNDAFKTEYSSVKEEQDFVIKNAKAEYKASVEQIKADHKEKIAIIKSNFAEKINGETDAEKKKEIKAERDYELKSEKISYSTALYEAKRHFDSIHQGAKDTKFNVFQDTQTVRNRIRGGKNSILENFEFKARNYVYSFVPSKFFLNNGLYLVIIAFFIIAVIMAPIMGKGQLLTLPNILTILEQSSTRMFYALGVAGLILLAGTDLSVGRMVALGSLTTAVLLHDGTNIIKFFGMDPWNFNSIPIGVRVVIALLLSCVLTTAFSCIAGFFTAKFKMHPFVTTLSTQLIIYGLLFYATSGVSAGNIDSSIKDLIGGRIDMGGFGFPKLIFYAVIAIIAAWFIWNKTKFGKNMYAVGGNSEAAAVSGINVFWVTMGVFIMAGIFYGCGSFLEAFRANASAGTGQGFELDAIAACVVGGISFSGGIGKIKGAVIGVIIFTGLTYVLSFLGIDTNLQFVFKGVIIMAAVALDSAKYLKKK